MAKIIGKLNRFGNRNGGLLAVLGVAAAFVFLFHPGTKEEIREHVDESDPWGNLLDGLGLGDTLNGTGRVKEFTIQYQSNALTLLAQGYVDMDSDFTIQSTATGGTQARFDVVCDDDDVCRTKSAPYQDPVTYFVVTVPVNDADRLVVTAGSAVLEVEV